MASKKNIYSTFLVVIFVILVIDEVSFILYNISLYQIFCGSNFIKIYESFFKLPLTSINTLYYESINNSFLYIAKKNADIFYYDIKNATNKLISYGYITEYRSTNLIYTITNKNNIYLLHFDTLTTQKQKIIFEVLQNKIYICPGETTLAFFRISNETSEALRAFSVYVVSPSEFTPFINKLQCFCYEELLLYPNETVDLPVLFRIENEILKLENVTKELVIEYIIIL